MILAGLDTVIVGNVDFLFEHQGGALLVPRDPNTGRACNGVVRSPGGSFTLDGSNDMDWTHRQPHVYFDDLYPGRVVSYKKHVKKQGLGDARIVYFHGREKPHEIEDEFVKEHWR